MQTESDYARSIYSTFNRWKSAYQHLSLAFDSFVKQSDNLNLLLAQPDAQGDEETIRHVNAAYTSLDAIFSTLRHVRASLGASRNQSRVFVPLNRLPVETIIQILSLANADCIIHPEKRPLEPPILQRLFNTSRSLRDVLIRAPLLWTHVDLITERPDALHHANSCIRYSSELPLHIHIFDKSDSAISHTIRELAYLLRSSLHRVVSFNFKSNSPFASTMLSHIWRDVTSSQVEEFCWSDHTDGGSPYNSIFLHTLEGRAAAFVRNLRKIRLFGSFSPLRNSIYRGLTVLKLVPLDAAPLPSVDRLVDPLTACPDLRSLTLIGIQLRSSSPSAKQVALPKLEVLDLRSIFGADLHTILSCLVPSEANLSLSITAPTDEDEDDSTEDFLRRYIRDSNVVRLLVEDADEQGSLAWLFGSTTGTELSALRELALIYYDVGYLPSDYVPHIGRFSGLQTLHLMRSTVDPSVVREAFNGSTIETLKLHDCTSAVTSEEEMLSELAEFIPCVGQREYPFLCHGEGDLEWPVYIPL